jgi:hypothetical protein
MTTKDNHFDVHILNHSFRTQIQINGFSNGYQHKHPTNLKLEKKTKIFNPNLISLLLTFAPTTTNFQKCSESFLLMKTSFFSHLTIIQKLGSPHEPYIVNSK